MSRLSLALCGLVLATLPCTSALADPLTFDFSFTSSHGISGTGSFTANSDGPDQYLIESIMGTTDTGNGTKRPIDMLLPPGTFPAPGGSNDNLLFYSPTDNTYAFDVNGVSYDLLNGAQVNLFEISTMGNVVLERTNGSELTQSADITITPEASPVPEPGSLALLGTGVLGLAGFVRRRLSV